MTNNDPLLILVLVGALVMMGILVLLLVLFG
jgi:hypothetical protein